MLYHGLNRKRSVDLPSSFHEPAKCARDSQKSKQNGPTRSNVGFSCATSFIFFSPQECRSTIDKRANLAESSHMQVVVTMFSHFPLAKPNATDSASVYFIAPSCDVCSRTIPQFILHRKATSRIVIHRLILKLVQPVEKTRKNSRSVKPERKS